MNTKIEPLSIKTFWGWNLNHFGIAVVEVTGGGIPKSIREQLRDEITESVRAQNDSKLWKQARYLIEQLVASLPKPKAIDIGDISGEITEIPQASCEVNRDIHIQYVVVYTNGRESREKAVFHANELSKFQLEQANFLHMEANKMARERFNEIFGNDEIDLKKWMQTKIEVFISYRSYARETANQLFEALGEYENRSVFLPRIDHVDLQAGNWIDQLQNLITSCDVFIPILTKDYLQGPVSKEEFQQAWRQCFKDKATKRIVPVLVEGAVEDYTDTFIGNHNILQAQDGLSEKVIQKIAHWAADIPENIFE